MTQEQLFEPVPSEKFAQLSKEELITLLKGEQNLRYKMYKYIKKLETLNEELKQKSFLVDEQLITIKNKLFGKSSERSRLYKDKQPKTSGLDKKKRVLLPSERYPRAPLIERHITLDNPPACSCCGSEMKDSGLTEESEYLTKVPAQYYVVHQIRHKYACQSCHGDIKTAPNPPRIKEGSSLSDEMMVDVALSKYCDLIPIERQAKIASREGLSELPAQSLIEATHYVAEFVQPAYEKLKEECLKAKVLHADETPHRMLEGDKKSSWFLWGFSTKTASYFEYHSTRSADVASSLLSKSNCEFLASDVYTGYAKAVKDANKEREAQERPLIAHVYCNAHARRYFRQSFEKYESEALYFVKQYRKIYRLESLAKKYPSEAHRIRPRMLKYFQKIRDKCLSDVAGYSSKSSLAKAMNYFLKNYEGLTRFISDPELPIDNNCQERLLRNPVIGRKTWYGTHSKLGAKTAAILFSLVESCKLNNVNPREYFKALVQELHAGLPAKTPYQFKLNQ